MRRPRPLPHYHPLGKNAGKISRMIKRLRKHGLIKKIRNCCNYYLTALGRRITDTALSLREMFIIPSLRGVIYED